MWVTSPANNNVTRVDPRSGQPGQQIPVGSGPTAVTFGLGSVWVANGLDSTVSRVDPGTDSVAAVIPVGDGPDALARRRGLGMGGGPAVLGADQDQRPQRQPGGDDPGRRRTGRRWPAGRGSVWVAAGPAASGRPAGGTLRVVSVVPPTSIDPALIYPGMQAQFSDATYDTLVTFQKTGGSSGLQLVPDLALAMPTVSAGGTMYTFTLRPGLRYSTGRSGARRRTSATPSSGSWSSTRPRPPSSTGSPARLRALPGSSATWPRGHRGRRREAP